MHHVAAIALGYNSDEKLENARKLMALCFPAGVVFTCARCGAFEMADVEETAQAMLQGWPRCHGSKMIIESREAEADADNCIP